MALPERFQLVLVCFLAAATCYLDRVGFPLAYTTMAQARCTCGCSRALRVCACACVCAARGTPGYAFERKRVRDACVARGTPGCACERKNASAMSADDDSARACVPRCACAEGGHQQGGAGQRALRVLQRLHAVAGARAAVGVHTRTRARTVSL